MKQNNAEVIKKIISKDFKKKITNTKKDLIKENFLDSINYVRFFSILEQKFKMEFDFDKISKINKLTIDTLDEFIKKQKK
tara:strand:+ start:899 stop:1138 length:240 start_codon:yes stop_codon:yes gene_type:complete